MILIDCYRCRPMCVLVNMDPIGSTFVTISNSVILGQTIAYERNYGDPP